MGLVILQSGNALFYRGHNTDGQRGVCVEIIKCISDRDKRRIKLIQLYAPTSTYNNEEVEILLEDTTRARQENKGTQDIIMEDVYAILEHQQDVNEEYVGKYGIGERNSRGDIL